MSVDKTTTPPIVGDNITIVDNIKININSNGAETFYFDTDKEIEIRNIEVKALKKEIVIGSNGIGVGKWVETDNYVFNVDNILKIKNNGYSARVILLDSPPIPDSEYSKPTLRLKFYIYYTLNGDDEKRLVVDSSDGKEIIYYSMKYYRNRVYYPYTIQVDSIYRPFFFNSIILFRDENYPSKPHSEDGNTHAIFTYSIANGCTLRHDKYPLYYIGDVKLYISNTDDEESLYEYNVKNHFRAFSEIESFEDFEEENPSRKILKDAHINGIKERGSDDGIMYLPKLGDCKDLFIEQTYEHENNNPLIPSKIQYYCGEINDANKIDVYTSHTLSGKPDNANFFNTKSPLNISFKVNDASPDNINYKTCEVSYNGLMFPSTIDIFGNTAQLAIIIKSEEYKEKVKFIALTLDDYIELINCITHNNVNDGEDNNLFNFLLEKKNNGDILKFNYSEKEDGYIGITSPYDTKYWVLAIYGDWFDDDFNYIKHTNKLTVMRLYNILL